MSKNRSLSVLFSVSAGASDMDTLNLRMVLAIMEWPNLEERTETYHTVEFHFSDIVLFNFDLNKEKFGA